MLPKKEGEILARPGLESQKRWRRPKFSPFWVSFMLFESDDKMEASAKSDLKSYANSDGMGHRRRAKDEMSFE